MKVSIIVAAAEDGVIGKKGGMTWYLPAELKFFKNTTMGHPIIMGRKTHESIGRALPGRKNIVITRDAAYKAEGCTVVNSLEAALAEAESADEAFVIGGAEIYAQTLALADKLYITYVDAKVDGDKHFHFDQNDWEKTKSEKHEADEKNKYSYEFTLWQRKKA